MIGFGFQVAVRTREDEDPSFHIFNVYVGEARLPQSLTVCGNHAIDAAPPPPPPPPPLILPKKGPNAYEAFKAATQ